MKSFLRPLIPLKIRKYRAEYKIHIFKLKIIKYLKSDSICDYVEKNKIIHFLKNNSLSVFPYDFIKKYIFAMMKLEPKTIGDLETAVIIQLTDNIGSMMCTYIRSNRNAACEISEPKITERPKLFPDERFAIDTSLGIIEIDLRLTYS